jgi:citrate synthase
LAGNTRKRRYSREDIERLITRTRERRNPEKAAEQALHWGMPVLESGITLIADGRIYFRGHDAGVLARAGTIAEVAALVWTPATDGSALIAPPCFPTVGRRPQPVVPFVAAAQVALALAAVHDTLAYDLRAHVVARTGWRILWQLAGVASGIDRPRGTIDNTLAQGWEWHASPTGFVLL